MENIMHNTFGILNGTTNVKRKKNKAKCQKKQGICEIVVGHRSGTVGVLKATGRA